MPGNRTNDRKQEDSSQGGMADVEGIVDRVVTSAIETLRKEFQDAMEKAAEMLKSHFTKELTEAVENLYQRMDAVEHRLTTLEQNDWDVIGTVDMAAVTKQINEAKVIANDTEQYTRRQNIRILGLACQRRWLQRNCCRFPEK